MRKAIVLAMLGMFLTGGASLMAADSMLVLPEGGSSHSILKGDSVYIEMSLAGWGAQWKYMGMGGKRSAEGDTSICTVSNKMNGAEILTTLRAVKQGAQTMAFQYDVKTDQAVDLVYIVQSMKFSDQAFNKAKAVVTTADGQTSTIDFPLARSGLGERVTKAEITDNNGEKVVLTFDPPTDVTSDNDARIILAKENFKPDTPALMTMTMALPGQVTFFPTVGDIPVDPEFEKWYTLQPGDYANANEIGMNDWFEKPAGKHGRVKAEGEKLIYNGKEFKAWGLNICYSSCAPEKELADKRAALYAKYGVNAVRLHKYADGTGWAGIQSPGSFVEFDAEALDRMDYFVAKLKEAGIYTKLSSTFGVKLGPDDKQHVPYMDEFGTLRNNTGRVSTGHGSVFLSRELQDLQIRQVQKLLNHKNPYTGLTYAEDPAILVVEMYNEDSALFFGTMPKLKLPTLNARSKEAFTKWLMERYGSEEALLKAWGEAAIGSFGNEGFGDETFATGLIPAGNPWFYDPTQLEGSQANKKQRMLDTMLFLYELQNTFYDRYAEGIRATGYTGEILASNWHAGRAFSHYYNLATDARYGMVDRHNYFGGGSGTKINNISMVRVPGSGSLSSGMEQVANRPFSISEWIHVLPNEWGVEGPAIIGAYGMGLQGWDVSFMFQNRDNGELSNKMDGTWNVATPNVMGVFPAVARQILRGDVKQSDVIAPRYVHIDSFQEGKIGFEDLTTQEHDVKTFDSDVVPAKTLAVARCVVEFTDEYKETPTFSIDKYVNNGVYASTTGQLKWYEGDGRLEGVFTMDTAGTKAVVGFAEGKTFELSEAVIAPKSRYGAIYVTAREPEATIETSKGLLVVAIARARNTDMKVIEDRLLLSAGKPPIVMEPVVADIQIRKSGTPTVHVLDHDGARTGQTLPINNGAFTIDTARDKTPYYLISYE